MSVGLTVETMRFGQKIRKARRDRGLTQGDIAAESGLVPSAISGIESGERRPYVDQASRIAKALGVSLDWLADDDRDDEPRETTSEDEQILRVIRAAGVTFDDLVAWVASRDRGPRLIREVDLRGELRQAPRDDEPARDVPNPPRRRP